MPAGRPRLMQESGEDNAGEDFTEQKAPGRPTALLDCGNRGRADHDVLIPARDGSVSTLPLLICGKPLAAEVLVEEPLRSGYGARGENRIPNPDVENRPDEL